MSDKAVSGTVRRSYDFESEAIDGVSRYVSERSTSLKPYTMSMFLNEAIREKLARHGYSLQQNGTGAAHKRKTTAARG